LTPAIPTAVLLAAGTEISLLQAGFRERFGALAIVIVLLILWYRQERRERAQERAEVTAREKAGRYSAPVNNTLTKVLRGNASH
jgi:hypothetical protein